MNGNRLKKRIAPFGLIPLMEGADGIRSTDELDEWYSLGLRLIGLSWAGHALCGRHARAWPIDRRWPSFAQGHGRFQFHA